MRFRSRARGRKAPIGPVAGPMPVFPDSVKMGTGGCTASRRAPPRARRPTATDQELRGEIVWNLYLGEAYPLEQASALAREIEEEPHG